MDKRPQRLAKNKSDLMPKNASCKRWDTLDNEPTRRTHGDHGLRCARKAHHTGGKLALIVCWVFQTPPDLVVKPQPIDIIGFI